jgi:hypothetical protein
MSSIIHKVKDAVTHHEHAHDKKHTGKPQIIKPT